MILIGIAQLREVPKSCRTAKENHTKSHLVATGINAGIRNFRIMIRQTRG